MQQADSTWPMLTMLVELWWAFFCHRVPLCSHLLPVWWWAKTSAHAEAQHTWEFGKKAEQQKEQGSCGSFSVSGFKELLVQDALENLRGSTCNYLHSCSSGGDVSFLSPHCCWHGTSAIPRGCVCPWTSLCYQLPDNSIEGSYSSSMRQRLHPALSFPSILLFR